MSYVLPNANDMMSKESWAQFLSTGMRGPNGALKSSSGPFSRNYAATSTSVSDILQGNLNYRYPTEISNLVNIALTGQLNKLGQNPNLMQYSYLTGGAAAKFANDHDQGDGDSAGSDGSGNLNPDIDPSTVPNTPEEAKLAGTRLLELANFQLAKPYGTSSGAVGYSDSMHKQLTEGFPIDSRLTNEVAVRDGDIGFLSPNLLNILWYICDNGYVLAWNMGAAGYKISKNGNVSQHSWGGAIDIGAIGREGETIYPVSTQDVVLDIFTEICELIIQAPPSIKPTEVGGPLDIGNGENTYDISWYTNADHQNHVHLGYSTSNAGKLLPLLSGRTSQDNKK